MKKVILWLVLGIFLISGCQSGDVEDAKSDTSEQEDTRELFAMDTYMTLKGYGTNSKEALDAAVEEINRLDQLLSAQNEAGEVYAINKNGGGTVSEDLADILQTALNTYEDTQGAFDITVYPLVKAWGFISKDYKVLSEGDIQSIMPLIGSDKVVYDENQKTVQLKEGTEIDLGAIAKGYTAQKVMDIFKSYGLKSGVISLGGNVQTLGSKTDGSLWKVGIQHPNGDAEYLGVVSTEDKAVVTSGGYERYFEEGGVVYHHLIDPKTGSPANSGIISASVVCEDGTMADALTTPLYVMGLEKAKQYWLDYGEEQGFEMILMTDDEKVYISEGLKDKFNSDYDYEIISR